MTTTSADITLWPGPGPGPWPSAHRLDLTGLFNDAVTGMAVVGLDGRFQVVNEALCRLLGYSEAELVGRHPSQFTHPDDRTRALKVMDRLLAGEVGADHTQKRYIHRDGSVITVVRTTSVLRDHAGKASGLFTQVVDVTAIARMEEEVRKSESRFKALVAHASELTLLVDRAGRIVYSSPACARVLGYSSEEIEGRSAFEFIHPDEVQRARLAFQQHMVVSGPSDPHEYRVRHRDGAWRDVEVVTTSLFDDPAVGALVLNVRDVTEAREYMRRLEAGERRFRTLVGNSWDIISLHDTRGRYLYCSPAVEQLGYYPDELLGNDPFVMIHPEDRAAKETFDAVAATPSRSSTIEYRLRHRRGGWRWLESVAENRLDDPAIGAVVVTTRDVTLRRRRALQQEALANLGGEALRGGPVDNLLARIPAMVSDLLEVPHCSLVRFESWDHGTVVASTDTPLSTELFSSVVACPVTLEAVSTHRSVVWDEGGQIGPPAQPGLAALGLAGAAAVPIIPANGPTGVLAVHSPTPGSFTPDDVAFLETIGNILAAALSRRNVEDQLRHQAVHDDLTGLPNRTLLLDRLETALARLRRRDGGVAVVFVDIDNFKLVNDSLGHSEGDSVVAAIARRLSETVRAPDTVARFGGDEFVVVSEDADEASARTLAERIHKTVKAPIHLRDGPVAVTASIGFATTSDPAVSPEALMADADMAMYEAKRTGKDAIAMFVPELRERTTHELATVSGIRRGLDHGEFCLFYQPIVSLAAGRPVGHEALVRWQHPTSGLLTPDQFVRYAESSGLILPLGEWVLRAACRQSAEWRRAGRPSAVSINVSGQQLTGSDLVGLVVDALRESGAEPADISLEVTESAVMSDVERSRATMRSLRDLGVHLGMDDFGTGWSSLSQLARLPFEFVKIDQSFVRDLEDDERTAAMLESIVALCGALDLRVVAEGVETERQLEHLKELQVDLIQGFLLGRPAPQPL